MKSIAVADSVPTGFQIAPMIDVVFVIMLFFMVMASSIKTERQLSFALPGGEGRMLSEVPVELEITIAEDGVVTLNEEVYDTPTLKNLPAFSTALQRIAADTRASKTEVLITVRAEELARYERIMDVLNAAGKAGFQNVTFTVGPEE